jgi:hypothetical protein
MKRQEVISHLSLLTAHCSLLTAHCSLFILHFSCYTLAMTITQTVEIPASHRLTIDIPREIPAGRTQVVIQFPVVEKQTDQRSPDRRSDEPVPKSADEAETSPVDALFALFAPIRGTVDIDEIRTERILAKHLKHLK